MIRLVLPLQLCNLASANREVTLDVEGQASVSTVLDALEVRYPMLRGTIRDQVTLQRRPFIRFFACGEDLSLDSATDPLPEEVASGREPLWVVGAMAGG
jgi:molybdopterin synthase sulfur carrier subunit